MSWRIQTNDALERLPIRKHLVQTKVSIVIDVRTREPKSTSWK